MIYLKYFIYLNVYKEKFVIFSEMERAMQKWKLLIDTNKSKIWDYEQELNYYCQFLEGGLCFNAMNKVKLTEEEKIKTVVTCYEVLLQQLYVPDDVRQEVKADIQRISKKAKNEYFVTVGFDDANITIDKIKKCLKSLVEMTSVKVDHMVVEKFRKDDNKKIVMHNHVHMIVSADYAKSKVVQFIFQKVAKYVQSKNFVDVKPCLDAHKKYIQGNKIPEKMECVELDKKWREENNLSSFSF